MFPVGVGTQTVGRGDFEGADGGRSLEEDP
jgi:hypothetical protein